MLVVLSLDYTCLKNRIFCFSRARERICEQNTVATDRTNMKLILYYVDAYICHILHALHFFVLYFLVVA